MDTMWAWKNNSTSFKPLESLNNIYIAYDNNNINLTTLINLLKLFFLQKYQNIITSIHMT